MSSLISRQQKTFEKWNWVPHFKIHTSACCTSCQVVLHRREAASLRSYDHLNTHQGQCLHSPQLCPEPDDCVSSSAAEEPVLQTAPQNPTAEQSKKWIKTWKFDCVLLSGDCWSYFNQQLPSSLTKYLQISFCAVLIILQLKLKLAPSASSNQTVRVVWSFPSAWYQRSPNGSPHLLIVCEALT